MRLENLTRTQVGELAPTAVAVLPIGATEQHGPHLPIKVDAFLVERVAVAATDHMPAGTLAVVCPTLPFGASHHHLIYPGTMSLASGTLGRVLADLTDSLVAGGFRRIYLLNGHGGNEEVVRLAARELALRHDVIAAAASYWTIAWQAMIPAGALEIGRVPGHAGGFETSLMLATDPSSVHTNLLPLPRNGLGNRVDQDPVARPQVHSHGSWSATDGYSDDARDATADWGEAMFEVIARAVAAELGAVAATKLHDSGSLDTRDRSGREPSTDS